MESGNDVTALHRITPKGEVEGKYVLVCFPYAGGSASSYLKVADYSPEWIDAYAVQLPGRHNRIRELPHRQIADAVREITDSVQRLGKAKMAFFGHSMGSLLAFETARELRRRGAGIPHVLAVSGGVAPRNYSERCRRPLDDLETVASLGGVPGELLNDESFLAVYWPLLQADLALVDSYRYTPEPPLAARAVVFGGDADELVPVSSLNGWRSEVSGPREQKILPGGHFFLWPALPQIMAAVVEMMSQD